ncbi:hypothetical protein [Oligella sp. HMSC09E12]|uniref:hypothetical protein n=1 Tax=Oligella sp. HMSC09E12 TaxID=1581147 RepID=UPI0008A2D791|nr:hypothetical protein [Oligella sp. HMSC09E12]OFV49858.1 hypothetical protein HMPREF3179_03395 [Oligella sp. HMSC09E12]
MYFTLDNITTKIIDAISQEVEVTITGGSAQSCSAYFEVNGMAVRVSDHDPTNSQLSHVDYFLALDIDSSIINADDFVSITKVFAYLDVDENENVVEIECNEHDIDAEHIGYRISEQEIERVVSNIIDSSKNFKKYLT